MSQHRDPIVLSTDIHSAFSPAMEGYLLHAWCPRGQCIVVYNGTHHLFGAGDCMIIPRTEGYLTDVTPDDDFAVEIIYVTNEFIGLCTPLSNYGMRGGMALFNDPIMHLTPEQQRVCALNFNYVRQRLAVSSHHFHRDAMINAVQCMIIDFFDFHVELYGDKQISTPQAQLIERFRAMLDRGDYRLHRDVEYYASQLCVTPKYLSEVSRHISGFPASYWINRYTSLEISRLLRNQVLTLDEIAEWFGFSSLSYFVRYVKKHLNLLPSEFRH